MADRDELDRLARRAAAGDVESARRLLARLEAGSKGAWIVVSEPPGGGCATFAFDAEGEDDLWRHIVAGPGTGGHSLGAFSSEHIRRWKLRAYRVAYEAQLSERIERLAAGDDPLRPRRKYLRGVDLCPCGDQRCTDDRCFTLDAELEAETAALEAQAEETEPVPADCYRCGGVGRVAGDKGDWDDCPRCRGTGRNG